MEHFLVIYNVRDGHPVRLTPFGRNGRRAAEAYAEAEDEYANRADSDAFEIVLLGADSLDTLKATHSRYFESARELMPF